MQGIDVIRHRRRSAVRADASEPAGRQRTGHLLRFETRLAWLRSWRQL